MQLLLQTTCPSFLYPVTQGATTPYPPVDVEVPWGLVAILVGAGTLALGATVVSLAWLLPRIGLADVLRMSED